MKQKLFSFLLATTIASAASAQLAQFHIGSAGHELATLVRPLPDGSSIVAGYNYQLAGTPPNQTMQNADIIFTRIDPAGNITWQRQYGQANTNDLVLDMIIAANGDIVAVGTIGRNNVFSNNTGFVFRINPNTGLIGQSAYTRATPLTTAGEYYTGVCELANGNILAVGAYDARSGGSDGLVSLFTPTLGVMYHERQQVSNTTDAFQNVVANGNTAFIAGYVAIDGTSFHDVTVSAYTPGTTGGTVNWIRSYAYGFIDNNGANLTNNFGGRISLRNNRLVINSGSSNNWSPALITRAKHFILRTDMNGNTPDVHLMSNTAQSFTNSSPIFPITDNEILYSQNPGPDQYQPELIGNVNPYDAVISHITNIPASTFTYTRNVTQPGTQSVVDLSSANGRYYFAGGSSGLANFGGNDMYFIISTPALQDPTGECPIENLDNRTTPRPVTMATQTSTRIAFTNSPSITLVQGNPGLQVRNLCGDVPPPPPPTDCDERCYWKLEGNTNITASHFLGSINSAEVRFRTDNNEVALFETDGDFGINLNPGDPVTAKLHVFCDMAEQEERGASNVRFEELMSGHGRILVIDDQGYVYVSDAEAKQSQEMSEVKTEMARLQAEIQELKQMLGARDGSAANRITITPNPTTGDVEVNYSLAKPYTKGVIKITDISGREIQSVPLNGETRGVVRLSIPGAAGHVLCTLYADGVAVSTEKIVINK